MEKIARLEQFMEALKSDVYPEIPSEPHLSITKQMIAKLLRKEGDSKGQKVLDIGCGQGLAMRRSLEAGMLPTGIALGEDVEICRREGLNVLEMDQSFLEFDDQSFDIIWCRHSIEHSLFPYFTLAGLKRVVDSHLYCLYRGSCARNELSS